MFAQRRDHVHVRQQQDGLLRRLPLLQLAGVTHHQVRGFLVAFHAQVVAGEPSRTELTGEIIRQLRVFVWTHGTLEADDIRENLAGLGLKRGERCGGRHRSKG